MTNQTTKYIEVGSPYAEIRIDTVGTETLITVYNVSLNNVPLLIEKLQTLIPAPAPQLVVKEEIVETASTIVFEDGEPAVMTAVLGKKVDPLQWYANALQKSAVKVEASAQKPTRIEEPTPEMPKPQRGKNIINIIGTRSKDHTRFGTKYEGKVNPDQNADIVKNESIRIYGISSTRVRYDKETGVSTTYKLAFDRTFKIGDEVEYGSYNMVYTGKIVKIGEKTITIDKGDHYSKNVVLDIDTFVYKNWDLDLAAIHKRNSEWYD